MQDQDCVVSRRVLSKDKNAIPRENSSHGADNDAGNVCDTIGIHDIIVHALDHFKGVARGDRIYKNISMGPSGVPRVKGGEIILIEVRVEEEDRF